MTKSFTLLLQRAIVYASLFGAMEKDKRVHRSIIWYEFKRGKKPAEICRLLKEALGDNCPCDKTIHNWCEKFRNGCSSIDDSERSGAPHSSISDDSIAIVRRTIEDDPHLPIRSIVELTGLTFYCVQAILNDVLDMHRVIARWVPKLLSQEQLKARKEACQELLQLYRANETTFIDQIITGDESWFHFYEPQTKQQSSQWLPRGDPPPLKSKAAPSMGKRMASVFWDTRGIILLEWLPERQTINSDYYISLLTKLKSAIKEQRRGKWMKGVWLQHDNARPHTSAITSAAIKELGFKCLPHPPYSPDLAPSDYYLFSAMKNPLRGKHFSSLAGLASAVSQWQKSTPAEWFADGLNKLPERWQKCVKLNGGYIERFDID
jgi:histone-lysine N-methyltransferase SETMAR